MNLLAMTIGYLLLIGLCCFGVYKALRKPSKPKLPKEPSDEIK